MASLARDGATAEQCGTAELILSELLGNVVRHAPGPVEIVLDRVLDRPILHVLDRGPGFQVSWRLPSDALAESGRGLFLVHALAEEFHIVRRAAGGSHAFALLSRIQVEARGPTVPVG